MKLFILMMATFTFNAFSQSANVKVEDIRVLGHQGSTNLVDFIPSVTKLQGKELQKKRQTSLGDTLQSEAGITSTQFGPSASRPVIRGLDGDRIRILQNSLGTLDASTQSLDHAVPVDTLSLDSIEIVRGPMSLLYGSSAVGGVVNLVSNRVHSKFEEGFTGKILTQGETVNSGMSSGAAFDYGKNGWMTHVDASTRNLQDQRIPGYARSSKERREDPLPVGEKEPKDKLPNSFNKQDSVSGGVSRILDKGYLGVSFNHFNSNYGTVAEEEVTIDMTQNRFELHSEYRPESAMFSKIKLKSAQSNYLHKEIEGGATGTQFKNEGNETRLEGLNQNGNIEGATGIQTQIFNFSASGEEAFLPKTNTQKAALFTFQELRSNQNTYSAGLRYENVAVEKKSSANFGASDDKNFGTMNGSLGYQYKMNENHSLSSSFSYTERAPNFQELYSQGAHLATGTFEQGDKGLDIEKAYAFELSFKRDDGDEKLTVNVYTQVFNDFIFLDPTGVDDIDSDLPIYNYNQTNALFYGGDIESKNNLGSLNQGRFNLVTKFDFIRAKDTRSGDNIPRISPPRVSATLEYLKDNWTTDIEVQYVAHQTKLAEDETKTDSYTLTNLGYTYEFTSGDHGISFFSRVRNIFDVTARNHVSTLKEIAPLAGRNFILGAQMQI
jgi:iron complex outermembrane receptor protein